MQSPEQRRTLKFESRSGYEALSPCRRRALAPLWPMPRWEWEDQFSCRVCLLGELHHATTMGSYGYIEQYQHPVGQLWWLQHQNFIKPFPESNAFHLRSQNRKSVHGETTHTHLENRCCNGMQTADESLQSLQSSSFASSRQCLSSFMSRSNNTRGRTHWETEKQRCGLFIRL